MPLHLPMALATVDWLVIAGYFALMVGFAAWFARRGDRDEVGFVLANRSMPAWAVGLSMLATAFGALDFVGNPAFAFTGDMSFLAVIFGGWISTFIIAALLLPAFYRAKSLTIYGYLGRRFGRPARVAGGVVFLVGTLLSSGAGTFVAAIALAAVLGGGEVRVADTLIAIVLIGGIGTLYTALGGIRSVIWTDVLQMLIIFGGGIYTVVYLLGAIPMSFGEIWSYLAAAPPAEPGGEPVNKLSIGRLNVDLADPYNLVTAFVGILFFLATFGTDHNFTQRLLTCRTPARAGFAVIFGYGVGIVSQVLFLSIGLLLFVFNRPEIWGGEPGPRFADAEGAYPTFLVEFLPVGMSGLALTGLFAAMMSSFDSTIASVASSFTADLVRPIRQMRRGEPYDPDEEATLAAGHFSRRGTLVTTLVVGALLTATGCLAAFAYKAARESTLLDFVLGIGSFAHGSLLGVFLCGLLTRRGNVTSVIAAMLAGVATWACMQPWVLARVTGWLTGRELELAWTWWTAVSTLVSFTVCASGRPAGAGSSGGGKLVT
ncbi:MAG: hypothetical protein ACFCVE_02940 [Phycisphaerae bacterium]